jgi:hypothetical protein
VSPRSFHPIVATLIVAFTVYFAATGSTIQILDLRTLAMHAAATDPDMMAIRESLDGPSNFAVIKPTDDAAPVLPKDYDFSSAINGKIRCVAIVIIFICPPVVAHLQASVARLLLVKVLRRQRARVLLDRCAERLVFLGDGGSCPTARGMLSAAIAGPPRDPR